MEKVSSTSTKAEILQAYNDLLDELKKERSQNTTLRQESERKKSAVETVVEKIKGGAAQNIQVLRKTLNEQLEKLEDDLTKEQKKFEELREAIAIEQKNLDDLYEIKAEAGSLDALLITHKQAKEKLEKELQAKKSELESAISETKNQWTREQEEYEYKLKLKRRNEEDTYSEKKAKQEKELQETKLAFEKMIAAREKAVAENEEKLTSLQKEVEGFEKRLTQSVKETEQKITTDLTKEFDFKQKLQIKDLEAELKLKDQLIESLKGRVSELQDLVQTLTQKTDQASIQVKDIALKAIENSGMRQFSNSSERRKDEKNGEG